MTKELAYPYVAAYKSGSSTITTLTTTNVLFPTLLTSDPYGMLQAGGDRFLIPMDGTYIIAAALHWNGETTVQTQNYRQITIQIDFTGTNTAYGSYAHDIVQPVTAIGTDMIQHVSRTYPLTKGTLVRVVCVSKSTGSANVTLFGSGNTRIGIAMIPGKVTS